MGSESGLTALAAELDWETFEDGDRRLTRLLDLLRPLAVEGECSEMTLRRVLWQRRMGRGADGAVYRCCYCGASGDGLRGMYDHWRCQDRAACRIRMEEATDGTCD